MLFGIELPQWLIDFWRLYGGTIAPILVTIGVSILSYIAIKIKSDAKLQAAKTDMQIQALQEVASKDNGADAINSQSNKLEMIAMSQEYMLQMFELAFQNSNLDPEIKLNLANLANSIRYGTKDDVIAEQQKQINQLNEQIADLTNKVNSNVIEEITTPEPTPEIVERR